GLIVREGVDPLLLGGRGGRFLLLEEEPLHRLAARHVPADDLGDVRRFHAAVDDSFRVEDDVRPVGAQPEAEALGVLDRGADPLTDELLAKILADTHRAALAAPAGSDADEDVPGV